MANYRNNDTTGWDAEQVRRSARPPESASGGRREYRQPPREPRETREPQETSHRRRKRPRRTVGGVLLYLLAVVISSAILAGVGWLLANDLCAFNKKPATATIEVTAQDDFSSVAKRLKEEGLIEYKWFFKLFGSFANADEKITEGVYELDTDMDYRALIAAMSTGASSTSSEVVTVTIPEGYTVSQIISLLVKNKVSTQEALTDAAQNATFDYSFIDNDAVGSISRLEGYLFPDTYDFYVGEQATSALNRLLKNFSNKMLTDEMQAAVTASGRSLKELVIIASLIEKETDGTDQATIASVIYNRLAGGGGTYGLLQIDAALLYDLPGHTGVITNADKETDSKYNLYENAGLPPTPIANPGLVSLKAAMSPESTKYYYYALGKDGKHRFFKTYDEHVNFINSKDYMGS